MELKLLGLANQISNLKDHHLRPHAGTVAMIERQMSKAPVTTSSRTLSTGCPICTRKLVSAISFSSDNCMLYEVIAARKEILDNRIEQLAEYLTDMAENKTVEELALEVKAAYIDMLNTEGRAINGLRSDRSSDPENNYKWTYASSFFFAMNVYTTTGYGSIAPETRAGQWFVIIYGFIFVPVTLVVVRDLGQWLLLVITRFYAKMLLKYRRSTGRKSDNTNEVIRLPIFISCLIMIGFIGFCTVFVYYLDAFSGPPGTGIDWFHSLYFSYMSFTTIGLGDVMPNNATLLLKLFVLYQEFPQQLAQNMRIPRLAYNQRP
ncbi:Ion channel [Ostertagia ostertagi]